MNEFTKEELTQIMDACMYWFECPDLEIMEEAQPLIGKIRSMIDNYCAHEHKSACFGCCSVICTSCGLGRVIKDDNH